MSPATKIERSWTLLFFISLIPLFIMASPQTPQETAVIPSAETIERELWNLINKERENYSLPLLDLSPALSEMARRHSLDMANQGEPTHLSNDGKTLIDRLADADFFYVDAGENVASSETFVAEFIHEELFESKGHRENILDPQFTQIGIGVIHLENKGYYVTQDFLRPLEPQSSKQAGRIILEGIDGERRSAELPPLGLWKEAEKFAQNLAEIKANGLVLPDIPPEFGETLVVFLSTPVLFPEESQFEEAVDPEFNRGAMGIWFGKNKDYPGGVYVIALLLFAKNEQDTLSATDQKKVILDRVNTIRTRYGLKILALDEGLSAAAQRIVARAGLRSRSDIFNRYESLTYGTENLSLLPSSLDSMIKNTGLRKMGVGLVHNRKKGSLTGTFMITLLFE